MEMIPISQNAATQNQVAAILLIREFEKIEHYKGLRHWVEDYKNMRHNGNVKGAKKIRDNIKNYIDKYNLDANLVWGTDPDRKDI